MVGFLDPEARVAALALEMTHGKPGVLAGDKIVMIAGTHDRFHRGGVEQAVLDEALIDVNANDLAEGDEARGGLAIDVDTRNGIVSLTGTVASEAEKARAAELAGRVESVIRVDDRLVVRTRMP